MNRGEIIKLYANSDIHQTTPYLKGFTFCVHSNLLISVWKSLEDSDDYGIFNIRSGLPKLIENGIFTYSELEEIEKSIKQWLEE